MNFGVSVLCNRSWATTVRKAGPHNWYSLNKTDTIVDFVHVIFKIIIQNLQTKQTQQILLKIGNITNYITFPPANSL